MTGEFQDYIANPLGVVTDYWAAKGGLATARRSGPGEAVAFGMEDVACAVSNLALATISTPREAAAVLTVALDAIEPADLGGERLASTLIAAADALDIIRRVRDAMERWETPTLALRAAAGA